MSHATPKTPVTPLCANCGASVPRKSRYCGQQCRSAFYNRMAKRGRVIMPYMLAWAARRGSSDPVAGAFSEYTRYLDHCNREDKAAGRPPMYDVLAIPSNGALRWDER